MCKPAQIAGNLLRSPRAVAVYEGAAVAVHYPGEAALRRLRGRWRCVGTFIDRHLAETVSDGAFSRALLQADEHRADALGVLVVGHWVESGRVYCVLEASSPEAIRAHHAKLGLPCDDMHEIDAPPVAWPLSAEDNERLRGSITTVWSPPAA
jgi:Protein of unknown function (DUF4242)